ncbi:response regulator [Agromyces binzhouensis]|uniref:response regulator n=1 Tax=Agromyces binzhouensis TaxID=1817495 RepID=UPI003626833D
MGGNSARHQRFWVSIAGAVAVLAGAVVSVVVTLGENGWPRWPQAFQLILFMFAAVAVAGILGFIFGVPRARPVVARVDADRSGDAADDDRTAFIRFEPNSNLEQISDWLTKILVGAGLVQLAAVPGALRSMGDYLGGDLGEAGPQVTVAIVLYGFGVGFLLAYLWARLRLRVLLETSEADAQEESRRDLLVRRLSNASNDAEDADSRSDITRAARSADRIARNAGSFTSLLWVDDRPDNNVELIRAFRDLDIEVRLATSTEEALRALDGAEFGLIISDLGRKENGAFKSMAGLELIEQVVQRGEAHPPIFIYASSRGMRNAERLREAGATLVTASPSELFDRTVRTLASDVNWPTAVAE